MKSERLPISVIIPVKNEAINLPDCLTSIAWADEVWVIDSHSTDETVEIAESYGAKVVQFDLQPGGVKKKNWALDNLPITNEWILLLDADERVTSELEGEIRELWAKGDLADGYYVNRKLIFLGKWIKHCGWYPSWNLRLFKHRLGRFEKLNTENMQNVGDVEVHEHVILSGNIKYLDHDLLHEDFKSIYHFVDRHNRYSTWESRVYFNLAGQVGDVTISSSFFGGPVQRKRFIKKWWVHFPGRPILRFFWMYIFKRGFLDGRVGLLFCALMMMHEVVISAKIFEQKLKHDRALQTGNVSSATQTDA